MTTSGPHSDTTSPRPPYFRVRAQRLEGHYFIDEVGADAELWSWRDLASRYINGGSPSYTILAQRTLRALSRGDFLAALPLPLPAPQHILLPIVIKTGRNAHTMLQRDPGIGERLQKIYRVLDLDWGATISVLAGTA
jgi:hypothetical protein